MAVIFIVGGAFEGKEEYARRNYPEAVLYPSWHQKVHEELKDGLDPLREIKAFFENYDRENSRKEDDCRENGQREEDRRDLVLISDEIGYGIIPMDADERRWREYNGRVNCYIAARADRVIRIVAGIPQRLK